MQMLSFALHIMGTGLLYVSGATGWLLGMSRVSGRGDHTVVNLPTKVVTHSLCEFKPPNSEPRLRGNYISQTRLVAIIFGRCKEYDVSHLSDESCSDCVTRQTFA